MSRQLAIWSKNVLIYKVKVNRSFENLGAAIPPLPSAVTGRGVEDDLLNLKEIQLLVESDGPLGTKDLAGLIYYTFAAKAATFSDSENQRAIVDRIWSYSNPDKEKLDQIRKAIINKGLIQTIKSASDSLTSNIQPPDRQIIAQQLIKKAGQWYGMDTKIRWWHENKLREFLNVEFELGKRDPEDFWLKQLSIRTGTEMRRRSSIFLPDVIAATMDCENEALGSMEAATSTLPKEQKPHNITSLYIIGSLPTWNLHENFLLDKEQKDPVKELRNLRSTTFNETLDEGQPSPATLRQLVAQTEKNPHVIPARAQRIIKKIASTAAN